MDNKALVLAISALAAVTFVVQSAYMQSSHAQSCNEGDVLAVFSPDNSEEIFGLLGSAKREIKLEVYEFSYTALADALIDARSRDVSVHIVLEPSVAANTQMSQYLLNGGVSVAWASKKFHNTHSKFAVIDDNVVLVGSTNWSKNAMLYNREASVVVYSADVARSFEGIFDSDYAAGR
ncbi:MAG: phospholipase D-like domain-containing protein [Candidatus Aenigmarchaeota archaeon]|nr:phospholipase D-like domain-containing protein [Candidatus Aenigmarchaeota archaeon]